MVFKHIDLADWGKIAAYCNAHDSRQLNYSFKVLYLWRNVCDFEVAEQSGFLFLKSYFNGKHHFLYPLGLGDLTEALTLMEKYDLDNGCEFELYQVNAAQKREIETLYPNQFYFEPSRDEFEYIFETNKLAALSGKKLQSKRNHINYFEQHNDWSVEEISRSNIMDLMAFCHKWDLQKDILPSSPLVMENLALMNALESFECLGLEGLILRSGDDVVAFSMGCPLSSDTYLNLFEKADPAVRGSYAMINREFVRRFCVNYRYVNRAEDNGDEGLRKAKLSYGPDILQEVYIMRRKA